MTDLDRASHGIHFRLLADWQLQEIHSAALEILRRTGVEVLDQHARELLAKAGATMDGVRARIPPHLVEWAIRTAPSRVVLCSSRSGRPCMHLEEGKSYFGTGSDTPSTIDLFTGEKRPATKADVGRIARVCDALPNIDFIMSMGIAQDVPAQVADLHHFEAMVSNCSKPVLATAWNLENLEDIISMAELVAGGSESLQQHPFMVMYTEPMSPLRLGPEATQKIIHMAGKGLPVICGTGKVGGATCPVTVAGAVAQGAAEALAGVIISQLVREGAPVIFGGERLHLDMSTTLASYGAPEFMLSVAANAELASYYHLPSWSYAGCSDAKAFDQQAAAEGMLMTFLAALSGGNLNHDVGYLEAGLTSSIEAIIASDEAIGMVRRIMNGVDVSDETLAVDVIDEIGPGGEFLTSDHTLAHFKRDWRPVLADRGTYDAWTTKGRKTLGDRANARAKEILERHVVEPLPSSVVRGLTEILEHGEKRVVRTQ